MRRVIVIFALLLFQAGCVSQSEYETLKSQNESLHNQVSDYSSKIDALEDENNEYVVIIGEKDNDLLDLQASIAELENSNAQLESTNEELVKKIDELEHGAERLLYDINNAYENKEYTRAINLAQQLHDKFNGSEEDIKAQEVAELCQNEIDRIAAEKKAEEERLAQEAAKTARDKAREVIRINQCEIWDRNSVGGVDVSIIYTNNSPDKTIKYVTFSLYAYNAVDDKVKCDIRGSALGKLKSTGPVEPGKTNGPLGELWDCVWYNYNIERIEIEEITIQYMDGSYLTLEDEQIGYVIY